jgi:hypothetical protein
MFERVLSHELLMDAMLRQAGADARKAMRNRQGAAWYEARTACLGCTETRRCQEWLATADPLAPPPEFCRGARIFHQSPRASPTGHDDAPALAISTPTHAATIHRRKPMSAQSNAETLLGRVRAWWRATNELRSLDSHEVDRIAQDLGMTADDLRDLTARGPDAAHELTERMRALGITPDDVERSAQGAMRDLERTCACCNDKGVCDQDLADNPGDPRWQRYCPNATTLTSVAEAKSKSTA